MRTRTSYDTSIKHLYREGLEKLIAPSIRKNIPRSTIHRWRQEKKEKYLGSELNELAKSELLLLKQFVHSRNERRIFMNYVRIGRFIEKISGERVLRKLFAENKAEFIKSYRCYSPFIQSVGKVFKGVCLHRRLITISVRRSRSRNN